MEKRIQDVFAREVIRQCEFTLRAAHYLNHALLEDDKAAREGRQRDRGAAWYAVQGFLTSAANVSKLFWPTPPKKGQKPKIEGRGEALRKLFEIGDDSPLAFRDVRNHFEHFDERLETWATSAPGGNLLDSNIIHDPSKIKLSGLTPANYLRTLNTGSMSITFGGDEFAIQPVVDAVAAILAKRATLGL
jgi:hypothetical protein